MLVRAQRRTGGLWRPRWRSVSAVGQSRSNQIRNPSAAGVVSGVAGSGGGLPTNYSGTLAGLTLTITGPVLDSGVVCVDYRFNGTTNSTLLQLAFETSQIIAAANGEVWSGSVLWRLLTGSLANVTAQAFRFSMRDSGGAGLAAADIALAPPGAVLERAGGATTLSNASTAFVLPSLTWTVNNAAAVDFAIRVGVPQAEKASAPTSPLARHPIGASSTGVHVSGR